MNTTQIHGLLATIVAFILITATALSNGIPCATIPFHCLNVVEEVARLTVNPDTLDFGFVGDGSKEMLLHVSNSGTSELRITDVSIVGVDKASFSVVSGGPVSGIPVVVVPGDSVVVVVSFTPGPTIFGTYKATLEFTSNAENSSFVQLLGQSIGTSVATETTNQSGAICMSLLGSNPMSSNSVVRVEAKGGLTVTVVDATGSVVSTIFDGSISGAENIALLASSFVAGTYSIVATNNYDRAVLKVIVTR